MESESVERRLSQGLSQAFRQACPCVTLSGLTGQQHVNPTSTRPSCVTEQPFFTSRTEKNVYTCYIGDAIQFKFQAFAAYAIARRKNNTVIYPLAVLLFTLPLGMTGEQYVAGALFLV